MSDLKATLAETLRAALVSVHPFNGEDYPSWFRDWIDQAAPEAAEAVLGLSGVAVTALPEPVQIADVIEQTLERKSQADLSVPFARGRVTAAILAADTEGADHA